ncbi:MAG: hypothetical protein HYZ53_26910 [Planctomycetes bacterium]|nr:hypothetical protein [Planctomycetota bacterium]
MPRAAAQATGGPAAAAAAAASATSGEPAGGGPRDQSGESKEQPAGRPGRARLSWVALGLGGLGILQGIGVLVRLLGPTAGTPQVGPISAFFVLALPTLAILLGQVAIYRLEASGSRVGLNEAKLACLAGVAGAILALLIVLLVAF